MPSMIAIVHSIYSKSVHAPAAHAGLMDNESERYCTLVCRLCSLKRCVVDHRVLKIDDDQYRNLRWGNPRNVGQ